jgi:hypothetical protein
MIEEYFCKHCKRVFHAGNPICCGEKCEEFSPEKHGRELVGLSNSWICVWKRWKDDPEFCEISDRCINDGHFGAAVQINEFILSLKERQNNS